ncbi:helix-turn-helix domain-containing protein [Methylobacterium sp. WSM2598]|uniref:helix-turn-helix domain-containing protein n=1 Tax=Methylobacterium sp. WSM2598 TaxID=398261 RepID=UPI0003602F38|nr:helix-turn-helix transcriptional regulator [Methylobacterium sp. WSM2598]
MGAGDTDLPESESLRVAETVREALARRRMSRQALADAARISLSTLEKALAGRRPFTRATTVRLEEALGVSLRGPAPSARHAPERLGAYSREAVAWLEGRYLTLRPSFGDAAALFAYRTEILWDPEGGRLVFREAERLDAPFAQSGEVSVPNLSGTIYLVTNWQGQVRLAMLGRPTIHGELYGLLTTLHAGRGAQLTPAACPLALLPDRGEVPSGRITPGMPAYAPCRRHLARVCDEGFGVVFPVPG